MNKADKLTLLAQIETSLNDGVDACRVFINGVRTDMEARKLGRQPKVAYSIWQDVIDKEVAGKMSPKHWTPFSCAKKAYRILYAKHGDDLQEATQIANLLRKGEKLKMPPAPPVEEKKEEVVD